MFTVNFINPLSFCPMTFLEYQMGKRLAIFSAKFSFTSSADTFITVEAIKSLSEAKFNKNGITKGSSEFDTSCMTQLLISDL